MDLEIKENQPQTDTPRAELDAMRERIEEIYALTNKTYKLFLWTMIATVVMFVLPLIALIFVIPYFVRTITSGLGI